MLLFISRKLQKQTVDVAPERGEKLFFLFQLFAQVKKNHFLLILPTLFLQLEAQSHN